MLHCFEEQRGIPNDPVLSFLHAWVQLGECSVKDASVC
jgi:hypothetical protein